MIEPFKRVDGYIVPEANADAKWFFSEPSIARREYKGDLMRLTPGVNGHEGWQYYVPPTNVVSPGSQFTIDAPVSGWYPVYPKQSLRKQIKRAFKGKWAETVTTFDKCLEFESADLWSQDKTAYAYGEYWLVAEAGYHLLIPVDEAEQISNLNELNFHELDTAAAFDAIQKVMYLLRAEIYGVIFTSTYGHKVRIRPTDFNWENYG